ncbi:hypothetical protein [Dakarella massiliensis]|uniref:hypothetical protein n=1 Tax=Dakarella massiliensis TaxID=1506471 RepID=UPI000670BF87|nr:hypothetical protein [Dakarella massiliensis]
MLQFRKIRISLRGKVKKDEKLIFANGIVKINLFSKLNLIELFIFNNLVYRRININGKKIRHFFKFSSVPDEKNKTNSNEYNIDSIEKKLNSYENKVCSKIIEELSDIDFDDAYIYKHHIGEIYLYLNLLDEYIKANGSKKPVVVINEKRYIDFYLLYGKDRIYRYIDLVPSELDSIGSSDMVEYEGHRIFNPTPDRFENFRKLISSGEDVNFYSYIKSSLHIKNDKIKFKNPEFSNSLVKSANEKLSNINLNKDNFVFLFPEAITATQLRPIFWKTIAERIKQKNIDILINLTKEDFHYAGIKTTNLSLAEAIYVSSRAKCIIALISGLVVSLSTLKIPKILLYTQQTPTIGYRMSSEEMLKTYSIKNITPIDYQLIREIDADKLSEEDLIETVLELVK